MGLFVQGSNKICFYVDSPQLWSFSTPVGRRRPSKWRACFLAFIMSWLYFVFMVSWLLEESIAVLWWIHFYRKKKIHSLDKLHSFIKLFFSLFKLQILLKIVFNHSLEGFTAFISVKYMGNSFLNSLMYCKSSFFI